MYISGYFTSSFIRAKNKLASCYYPIMHLLKYDRLLESGGSTGGAILLLPLLFSFNYNMALLRCYFPPLIFGPYKRRSKVFYYIYTRLTPFNLSVHHDYFLMV